MALQDLVMRYVPEALRPRFTCLEGDQGTQSGASIVFVATLWNGKSQLAFKKLVSSIESLPGGLFQIFIVDDETEYGQAIQERAPRLHWSHGCIFSKLKDEFTFLASGVDLAQLELAINEFNSVARNVTSKGYDGEERDLPASDSNA